MNILFVNSRTDATYGGGEKWLIQAATGIHRLGHHVVMAGREGSLLLKSARENNIETYETHIPRDICPIVTWRLKHYLIKKRMDVVVCNTNRDVRVVGLAAKLAGIRNVYARHGLKIIENKVRYTLPLKWLTNGIITNTLTIKDEYESYRTFPRDFINVVYNGIETIEDVAPFDFSLKFPGEKIILAAGRLTRQKGFGDFIDAAALLCKKRNDLVFLIAGKGELEQELNERIKTLNLDKKIFLIGFHHPIYPLIKGADLFVLSSLCEGLPNVVMEAMMLQTPVVATNVNGVPELIQHNHSGIIVDVSNPIKLAEEIERLLNAEETMRQLVNNAYQTITTDFSNGKMIENLIHIFSKGNIKSHSFFRNFQC